MSAHTPIATPIVGAGAKDEFANERWVAFNWRSAPAWVTTLDGVIGAHAFVKRPEAGERFHIYQGVWSGDWIVRAHDATVRDIFFAERVGDHDRGHGRGGTP